MLLINFPTYKSVYNYALALNHGIKITDDKYYSASNIRDGKFILCDKYHLPKVIIHGNDTATGVDMRF